MSEQELLRWMIFLRRPIHWDPPPPWLKLGEDKIHQFTEIQNRWNAKINDLENQKAQELAKVMGTQIM